MNYTHGLTPEQLQAYAPAAFAGQPYSGMSSRYGFVRTIDVIDAMRDAGFVPVAAQQSSTRILEKSPFTKHMIRFRSERNLTEKAVVGNTVLEMVMTNSHDGSSLYQFFGGAYRFTCENGMMVSDGLLQSFSVRHTKNLVKEALAGTTALFEKAPVLLDTIRQWMQIQLSDGEQLALAKAAQELRFTNPTTGLLTTNVTPELLLNSRRYDDNGNDLWHVYNRVQENATKGVRIPKTFLNRGRRQGSKAVTSIDGNVQLQRGLWTLATEMAKLKS